MKQLALQSELLIISEELLHLRTALTPRRKQEGLHSVVPRACLTKWFYKYTAGFVSVGDDLPVGWIPKRGANGYPVFLLGREYIVMICSWGLTVFTSVSFGVSFGSTPRKLTRLYLTPG